MVVGLGNRYGNGALSASNVDHAAVVAPWEFRRNRLARGATQPAPDGSNPWVGGGSVANLLAVWRVHGLDEIFREVWEAGVVLGGVSAGSLCWHVGGTTDSFGPDLRPVTDGLALIPTSNGVHYDSEEQRRPLYHRLVADGTLPGGHATDDGVGLVYRGTELVEAVADRPDKAAYRVEPGPDGTAVETRIEPRRLR